MVKRGEWLTRYALTAKERIVLHLREVPQPRDLLDVSIGLTQEGIAEATGIRVNHVSRAIAQLKEEGLVAEGKGRVRGQLRKRKVYRFTEDGYNLAERVKEEILKKRVKIRKSDRSILEVSLKDIEKHIGVRHPLTEIIHRTDDSGVLDMNLLEVKPQERTEKFISFSEGLTLTEPFYGRKKERESIRDWIGTSENRILAIRGAEGMGKSSLAAQVFSDSRDIANLFWYSFRNWDTPETLLGALSSFFSQLGKPGLSEYLEGTTMRDPRGALGALATRLKDTRALLFFDNLNEMSSELGTVLYDVLEIAERSSHAKVILISENGDIPRERELLARGALYEIALGGLDKGSCKRLLSRKIERKEFDRIFRLTEGHPLSFKLISTRGLEGLGEKKDYTPEELAVIRYMKLFEEP
ncbi:MAG: helix-turn-helix domain-containing protein [Thermoplasmata archaeon]